MANSAASTGSAEEESWANISVSGVTTGQLLEAVISQTEPSQTEPFDDGYGIDRPIGRMILGQPPAGQVDAAEQDVLGQAAGSGPMGSLSSWDVHPLPSVDVQHIPGLGQSSDGQSSVGTWVIPDLGSSRENR